MWTEQGLVFSPLIKLLSKEWRHVSRSSEWCNSLLELPAESDFCKLHGKGTNTEPEHRHMGCNIWWQKTGHIPSLDSSTALQGETRQVIKCARVALWRHVHVACRPPITSWGSSLTRKPAKTKPDSFLLINLKSKMRQSRRWLNLTNDWIYGYWNVT